MDICVIGAGYVGLTSAAVLADLGHSVSCLDTNREKIKSLTSGEVPIFEPGLEELIRRNRSRLTFDVPTHERIKSAPVILIAVGTPSSPTGQADLTYVSSVIDLIAESLTTYKTIITKSTVPPGTNDWIHQTLVQKGVDPKLFTIVSNPEFLREGTAIKDMVDADKIVVGKQKDDQQSLAIMEEIYQKINAPFIVTTLSGAEMIKYTSNAFLATKISFINEIARICDQYDVNVEDVVKGISTDPRISPHFLNAGIGYGGSCFPKDVRSLVHSSLKKNVKPTLLQAVQSVNQTQVDLYLDKLLTVLPDLSGKKITVLGIAFKPNTDDTRYSPAVALIQKLSALGCIVHSYDPQAHLPVPQKESVTQDRTVQESVEDADCVVIATEWDEFLNLNWQDLKKWMNGDLILDARNCLDPTVIRQHGLRYLGVAKS
ncbi:UDP-glucose dehydrogenase family protein [Sporolactobacillus kofuensis]|uniref:UDP-glucose 6-dehydrogenase n=1 Tax=Sporolactobacillus kofuensis TaxID=269672 RepID=A0ABW1WCD5_9BACL|nr:UDP-glucose/GDP-mannose dehydrogenase family protein [Sporolactobacillus kofuensis]MCO7175214.1 UDP-glucose/GDP-mannose dehydrogenase family protein [Sporolactobacillus kofuensis]